MLFGSSGALFIRLKPSIVGIILSSKSKLQGVCITLLQTSRIIFGSYSTHYLSVRLLLPPCRLPECLYIQNPCCLCLKSKTMVCNMIHNFEQISSICFGGRFTYFYPSRVFHSFHRLFGNWLDLGLDFPCV